jgi:hypothetical protein
VECVAVGVSIGVSSLMGQSVILITFLYTHLTTKPNNVEFDLFCCLSINYET